MLSMRDLGLGCAAISILILAIFFVFPQSPPCPMRTSATITGCQEDIPLRFGPGCDGFTITNTSSEKLALKNFTMEFEGKQRGICVAALAKGIEESKRGLCGDVILYAYYTAEIGPWPYIGGEYTLTTGKGDINFLTENIPLAGGQNYILYAAIAAFLIAIILVFLDSRARRE